MIELVRLGGLTAAYISCPPRIVPSPGAYLLAVKPGGDSAVAVPVFPAKSFIHSNRNETNGFLMAPPLPESWTPGTRLHLRGPLGHGFKIPSSARRIALVAFDSTPLRLLSLVDVAFDQGAELTLLCESPVDDLPLKVEVQPRSALADIYGWSDFIAFDLARESLHLLKQNLVKIGVQKIQAEAQVLIRTPMPCGGLAECGVCTVETRSGPRLACLDGPVFDLKSLLLKI